MIQEHWNLCNKQKDIAEQCIWCEHHWFYLDKNTVNDKYICIKKGRRPCEDGSKEHNS